MYDAEHQTPANKAKMDAAVARWIADAAVRFEGPELLEQKALWVRQQMAKLAATAHQDDCAPGHLSGLVAVDLIEADSALLRAAGEQRAARQQRMAAEAQRMAAEAQRVAA